VEDAPSITGSVLYWTGYPFENPHMATLFNWGVFASKHRVSKFEDGGKIFDYSLCQKDLLY
jgi:hypothetical protein